MWPCILDGNMDFCILEIADEALTACIEKGLGVLGLRACLENLLVVENDCAVRRREVVLETGQIDSGYEGSIFTYPFFFLITSSCIL